MRKISLTLCNNTTWDCLFHIWTASGGKFFSEMNPTMRLKPNSRTDSYTATVINSEDPKVIFYIIMRADDPASVIYCAVAESKAPKNKEAYTLTATSTGKLEVTSDSNDREKTVHQFVEIVTLLGNTPT